MLLPKSSTIRCSFGVALLRRVQLAIKFGHPANLSRQSRQVLYTYKYGKQSKSRIWYREPDLNRHERNAQEILSLSCLPIPSSRHKMSDYTTTSRDIEQQIPTQSSKCAQTIVY